MTEITETEHEYENLNNEKRIKINEDSLRDLWYNIKYNIQIIGFLEEDKIKSMKRNSHPSPGSPEPPQKDKLTEKHNRY